MVVWTQTGLPKECDDNIQRQLRVILDVLKAQLRPNTLTQSPWLPQYLNMCGRFVLSDASWAEYHEALSILTPSETRVSYNIKPTQTVAVVYVKDGAMGASMAR